MVRMIQHPQTRAYADRRRSEGKTNREIRRCLKRYLARRLYRRLNTAATKLGSTGYRGFIEINVEDFRRSTLE